MEGCAVGEGPVPEAAAEAAVEAGGAVDDGASAAVAEMVRGAEAPDAGGATTTGPTAPTAA